MAGLEEGDGRVVVDLFGVHRLDDAEFIHDLGRVRQQLAHPGAALAVLIEPVRGCCHGQYGLVAAHACESLSAADGVGQMSALQAGETGFVVEGFKLGGTACHEEEDDLLRPGGDAGQGRHEAFFQGAGLCAKGREQLPKGEGAEAHAGAGEEVAAIDALILVLHFG